MNDYTESIELTLLQMHIKYLEEFLKINVNDFRAKDKLKQLRDKLKDEAGSTIHWD